MADSLPGGISQGMLEALAQRLEQSHDRNLNVRHEATGALINTFLEAHEQDLASLVKPHLEEMCRTGVVTDKVRTLFETLCEPAHQTQFFTAIFAIQGIINAFVMAALGPYVQETSDAAWLHKTVLPLSPAELALAELRHNLNGIDSEHEAARSGIDAQRFKVLKDNTGEPLGLQGLNEAFRREIIDEGRLARGVRQSRVRDEWLDVVLALRYAPPSPAEVLRGTVQNHLPLGEAVKLFKEGGINPDHFQWMLETAGRPPGIMELVQLWRRDKITQEVLEEAIRESDIKNKYIPAILEFKRHVLPQRTVVSALRHGVIDDDYARQLFKYEGVADEDIVWLIKEAHAQRAAPQKELSLSVLKALYSDGYIDRAEFIKRLVTDGYSEENATEIVNTVEYAKQHAVFQAAIRKIGNLYIAYRLTDAEAKIELDKLTLRTDERDRLLHIWGIEREANTRDLTRADIDKFYKHGLIGPNEYVHRLTRMGYSQKDAEMLLQVAPEPPKPKTATTEPTATAQV